MLVWQVTCWSVVWPPGCRVMHRLPRVTFSPGQCSVLQACSRSAVLQWPHGHGHAEWWDTGDSAIVKQLTVYILLLRLFCIRNTHTKHPGNLHWSLDTFLFWNICKIVKRQTRHLKTMRNIFSFTQEDYDGRGQRSCKCNYVDTKWALPPCSQLAQAVVG